MILPDDKNPSIVWDAEKKKWVNTDGDEDEQEALKPPPKMSDLMPQQIQQPQQQQQPLSIAQQQQQQVQTNPISFMDGQQQTHQPQIQQFVPNAMPQAAPSPDPLQQQQQNLNPNQPQAPGPAKTPTLQSNMFKMQRNRSKSKSSLLFRLIRIKQIKEEFYYYESKNNVQFIKYKRASYNLSKIFV